MKNETAFFSQLTEVMRSYEEAYIPGAWEEFCQKRDRRRTGILLFRLAGTAAVLLLCSALAFFFFSKAIKSDKGEQVKTVYQHHTHPSIKDTISAENHPMVAFKNNAQKQKSVLQNPQPGKQQNLINTLQQANPMQKDSVSTFLAETSKDEKKNGRGSDNQQAAMPDTGLVKSPVKDLSAGLIAKPVVKKQRTIDELFADSLLNRQADKQIKKDRNLIYGIVLSPSLGNQKFNFGTGLEVSYKVTGNLFLNSGISYSSIHAATSGSDSSSPSAPKQLQGANLDISGFQVPLGLQYRTQGGFYATAGIVGMTVISNSLEFNYLTQRTETTTVVDGGGVPQQVIRVVSEQQTEKSPEKITGYLGFYTLSFGQKKNVGKNQINFGPFINIPFGPVSSENIRFMQGGIRLGFGF